MLHTARTPDPGCLWEPLVNRGVHIALLVEHCAASNPGDMPTISAYKPGTMIEIIVFTKPAAQTLDAAAWQQITPQLKLTAARAVCHMIPDTGPPPGSSWKWSQLSMTSGPLLRRYKSDELADQPCDPWEMMDAEVNFFTGPRSPEPISSGYRSGRSSRAAISSVTSLSGCFDRAVCS
jgi:hypothetical protein